MRKLCLRQVSFEKQMTVFLPLLSVVLLLCSVLGVARVRQTDAPSGEGERTAPVSGEPVTVAPNRLTVVEGSYSCHPALWDYYDLRVFLTVDPEEQLRRIEKRSGPEKARQFRDRWIPFEEAYFRAYDVQARCDLAL